MNKICTSIEQSQKLIELGIDVNTADMALCSKIQPLMTDYISAKKKFSNAGEIPIDPCWSLAALSEFILPYIADDDGNNYKFYLSKDGLDRWIAYYKSDDVSIHICEESDNMIDVILEMVCWLKKEEYI